ncbi:hypothetical protein HAX54_038962 [Datura stramonium]|uniref:Uncharacterized protein n=1 Tax=Datura stramonium TaxID=4076 RepID=A0ABS8VM72_DATST|nr:hypothetical protein [Datura stramonium]
MLVWDDKNTACVKTRWANGFMMKKSQTISETMYKLCVVSSNPDDGRSIIQNIEIGTMFTHHQKIVIVDGELPNGDTERGGELRATAWDVLSYPEQRWRKQGGKDLLINLRDIDNIIIPPSPLVYPDDHDT